LFDEVSEEMNMNVVLWIIQGLLAALFLFAGGSKFVMPPEVLTAGPPPLPLLFVRFIGVCELLGAIGLILPSLLRIRTGLTPLAAAGLVIIMAGATALTAIWMSVAMALIPLVVGLLAATVAYGRWRLVPIASKGAESSRSASAVRRAQV
jgi:uncharacterized membrane protein